MSGSGTGGRDLRPHVDRFGKISVDVTIGGGPGAASEQPHGTGASATPVMVAGFLRDLAVDVEQAGTQRAGDEPSEERPVYRKVSRETGSLWFIECDEGWRSRIVCDGMYEPDADWLLELLGRRPFTNRR